MGRVVTMWSCGPATCGTSNQYNRSLSFAYDWVGNLTQSSDGSTGTINYGRSIAGEVTSITNATYQNLPYNPPNLVSNVVNGANGPVSYTLGNGLNVYLSYDTLGRPNGGWVCNGPAAQYCNGGTQIYGTNAYWHGSQMQGQSDTLNDGVTYGYGDGLNRLTSRTVTAGPVQNYTYAYDRYGNRVSQTPLQGGYSFNPTINPANNQITTSGYTYDAAGNMTNDTVHTYTYDAEGNITKVDGGSTAQYVYDVFNHRIHVQTASATNEYVYDPMGRRVSTWLSPNNSGSEGRIYWGGGRQIAYRSIDGTTYFDHQDMLGTERMRTTYSGTVGSTYTSLPWGDGYTATVNTSGADQDNLHYAGLDRDAESGTEHAQFRNYASVQGRWLAPDSYLGSYDLKNPQSMNRYAYALNNSASSIDPSGLFTCPVCNGDGSGYDSGGDDGGGGDVGGANPGNPGSDAGGPGSQKAPSKITCQELAAGQAPTSNFSSWLEGSENADYMTSDWALGVGPTDTDFGPNSVESQQMMGAYGLAQNVSNFLAGGASSGNQNFGLAGLFSSGLNPTAQFVGSYQWSMALSNGNLNITITNSTTAWSAFYHSSFFDPNPPTRTRWSPGGRVNQTFHIQVPCS